MVETEQLKRPLAFIEQLLLLANPILPIGAILIAGAIVVMVFDVLLKFLVGFDLEEMDPLFTEYAWWTYDQLGYAVTDDGEFRAHPWAGK